MRPRLRLALAVALALAPMAAGAAARPGFATATGERVSIASFRGKPVLVELWASWCAPCMPGLLEIRRIANRFGPRRLSVVPLSVDRGGAPAALRAYARLDLAGLPLYLGDPATTVAGFGARALPTAILFDARGREVARFGNIPSREASLIAAIDRLLPHPIEGEP